MPTPRLFEPLTIAGVRFRNRIVLSPMCQYKSVDGFANGWHLAHHARFALGGVGAGLLEASGVTAAGRITPGCLGIWKDEHVEGLSQVVELYHGQGIPVGIQIAHAGRKASAARPWDGAGPLQRDTPEPAWQTVGPSAVAHADGWPVPHALSETEIDDIVGAFAAAATRAVRAGFDFVEIHGAHGYLIHSFFSPLANQRTDQYGGSRDNRMRFALQVTEAVRKTLPGDKALFYRVSAIDDSEGGVSIEDTIALAKALKQRGVDVVDVSSGGIFGPIARGRAQQMPGHQVPFASAIRKGAGIATMAVGLILDPAQAEAIIAEGHADFVALGRQLIAEPNFAYRAAIELGLDQPSSVLPLSYDFYLARRVVVQPEGQKVVNG